MKDKQVRTPGATEVIPFSDLLESIKKDPENTLASIMSDFHWLHGFAQGLSEGYELKNKREKHDNQIND
jgi:hypothetical protein